MLAADGWNTRRRETKLSGTPTLSESFNSKASERRGRGANISDEIPVQIHGFQILFHCLPVSEILGSARQPQSYAFRCRLLSGTLGLSLRRQPRTIGGPLGAGCRADARGRCERGAHGRICLGPL